MSTHPSPSTSPQRSTTGGGSPTPLSRVLRQAAAELHRQAPPPWPELPPRLAARQGAAAVAAPARPAAGFWRRAGWSAAACATVVAGAGWLVASPLGPAGLDHDGGSAAAAPFLSVAPAERWLRLGESGAPAAWLVPAELPRARLASLGLPFDPGPTAEPVRAELLLSPAGEVLAVRVAPLAHAPSPPRSSP